MGTYERNTRELNLWLPYTYIYVCMYLYVCELAKNEFESYEVLNLIKFNENMKNDAVH